MAILNCTPDSFYDGGHFFDEKKAILHGLKVAEEGADLIDIGGESTRPQFTPVTVEEEMRRVRPVIQALRKECSLPLSIDSSKPEVVQMALEEGVRFINDVTGFTNPKMRLLARDSALPICLMHRQNTALYPRGIILEIYEWFQKQLDLLLQLGISQEKIYLDVGIGFGKSVEDNLRLLKHLEQFKKLGCPLLIGLSRKSFMQKILNKKASEVLSTTLALNTMSLLKGVDIVRVHDVKEHKDIVSLLERIEWIS